MRTTKRLLSVLLSILIVISSLLISAFNTSAATIPNDAFEYNGHLYKVYSNVCNTWEAAKAYCEALGGHLAVITSKEENAAVYSYIRSLGYKSAYFGWSDSAKEGAWEWVTGEKNSYTNWSADEPNGGRDENYAEFYWKFTDGTWNDGNFGNGTQSDSRNFICEWDVVSDGSFIGTLEDFGITTVLDSPYSAVASPITVDGVKYPVKQGKLSVDTANAWQGRKVCVYVEDGVVTWINLLSKIKNEPTVSLNSVSQADLTYKDGRFTNKKIALTGSVRNVLQGVSLINTAELFKSMDEYSLSDVSLTLTSGNTDLVYFKKQALFSKKEQSITFDIADKMLAEDSITFSGKGKDIEKEMYMYVNMKYKFPENLEEKSVDIEYTLNAKQNGLPITVPGTLTLKFVNDDYGKNDKENIEAAKKNWKKQTIAQLYAQMKKEIDNYPGDKLMVTLAVCGGSLGNTINNIDINYNSAEVAYDFACYFYDVTAATPAELGKAVLDHIIDNCETASSEMKSEIRTALQSLFSNEDFCDFLEWYRDNRSPVVSGQQKEQKFNCPIDVTITDEDGNIVASIVNDEVVFTAEDVSAYVNKETGQKTVYLPTYIDHRVQITATDNGTMDYSVTEYNASGDEVVVSYEDIPLTKDKVCTGVVVMDSMPEEGSYELTEMTLDKLSFSGASLTLQDNICINYKANETLFTEVGYENPFVLFELNGKEYIVSDYRVVDGKYVFDFADISPANINDTVKATLYATYDGATYVSETREYSVATYCYNMLSKYNTEEYAEFRTLLVDLLNYGAAAQTYIDHNTDDLANAELTEEQQGWATSEAPEYETVQNIAYKTIENPTVQWLGGGLNLKDSVEMRFKISADSYENLTVKSETKNNIWTLTSDTFDVVADGCYVFFDGLDASQMSEPVYLTVYDGDTAVSNTICYSVESYAYAQRNSSNENLVNLLAAMMKYGNAARNYADNYTVTFKDYNGAILKTQMVNHGSGATAPDAPVRSDGWLFCGWDKDFSNVTEDITVTAMYEDDNVYLAGTFNSWSTTQRMSSNGSKATMTYIFEPGVYELKFVYRDNWLTNTGTVLDTTNYSGQSNPWELYDASINIKLYATGGKYTIVFYKDTMTFEVKYEPYMYTVTFVDYDGTVLKEESVSIGSAATAPANPTREGGYEFYGWDTDFSNVTKNLTVTAIYSNQNVQLLGDVIGSWTVADGNRMTYHSDGTNTKTITLPKGTYELKIYTEEWGCWLGNSGTVYDSCSGWDVTEGTNNLTLNASGGVYTFTFNRITQKLSIDVKFLDE